MSRWILHYHPEVVSYLISLRESGAALRLAIRSLETNPRPEQAIPLVDWPNTYDLFVEGHLVRYRQMYEQKVIRILLAQPGRTME